WRQRFLDAQRAAQLSGALRGRPRQYPEQTRPQWTSVGLSDLTRWALPNLKPDEVANDDLIAQLFGDGCDMLLDGDFGVMLYKTLINQAVTLVELLELAFHNLCDRLRRFVLHLFARNFLFLGFDRRRYLFTGDHLRMGGGNLQGNVADQ